MYINEIRFETNITIKVDSHWLLFSFKIKRKYCSNLASHIIMQRDSNWFKMTRFKLI